MIRDFGRPPGADRTRTTVEELLAEAAGNGGLQETLTVDWRGQLQTVPVVSLPVDVTWYNPGTHRIRAQRSHDPVRDRGLDEAPWSPQSQDYLHFLLQALPADPHQRDPRFDELLESLKEFKQTDPGLVTRDGVLVNANTRRAALKELGVTHIRVGVLPASCTWSDVSAVELSLQLRKDHRRDYSYINRLLTVEEQLGMGRPLEDIARELRVKPVTCEQDLWVLTTLRDLIDRSRNGDEALRLLDFESQQEKLKELHRKYEKEVAVNRDNAELLKENRLSAIVLGFSKTDVRLIEPDFTPRYLERHLPEWFHPEDGTGAAAVAIPGLNRSVRTGSAAQARAKALTNMVLKLKSTETSSGRTASEETAGAARALAQLKGAFDEALKPAGSDARIRKRKQAAPDRINDACGNIEQCITDLVLASASRSLDEDALDDALLVLREALRKLAAEAARRVHDPGDGVSWLLEVGRRR